MALAETFAALGVTLPTVGGGIAWIWNRIDKRFRAIDLELENCRNREVESIERRGVQLAVIELLWAELMRIAPQTPVLARGKKLLDQLKDQVEGKGR